MSTVTQKILDNLKTLNASPDTIERLALSLLQEVRDGIDIVDANSPFIYLLGMSAVNTCAHIHESRALARKRYAKLAQTDEDLYHHLSDKDRVGRWASPGYVDAITVRLPYTEIVALAKSNRSNSSDAVKYIRIPRDTQFTVGGYPLGIHYPIVLNVLPNNGFQVTYDESISSPLETLTTNVVTHRVLNIGGELYIDIDIPCHQFDIVSDTYQISPMASFTKVIAFQDKYYATRAYRKVSGSWVEMEISHSFDVYDINKPTLVIEVIDNRVICRLPEIYVTTQQVSDELRIDVYNTKGAVSFDLSDMLTTDFTFNWRNLDTVDDNYYSASLDGFSNITVYSVGMLSGGRNAMEFNALRDKVIYRVSDDEAPVTPLQLVNGMALSGYTLQRYVDNLTDRVYVASRNLPLRDRDGLRTATSAINSMVPFTDLDAGYNKSIVRHAGSYRTTVKANAMFIYDSGRLAFVSNHLLTEWLVQSTNNQNALADSLRDKEVYYTPFYYVLDYTGSILKTRAYHLDKPSVFARSFIRRNADVPMNVVTSGSTLTLEKDIYGFASHYLLTITTTFPKGYLASNVDADIYLTLKHFDKRTQTVTTLTGSKVNPLNATVQFTFRFDTKFDITGQHEIVITTLDDDAIPLDSTFELNYAINDLNAPGSKIAVTEETIGLRFGEVLEGLYVPCRSIIGNPVYATHSDDVQAVWDSDQYVFEDYGPVLIEAEDGELELEILAHEGDPMTTGSPPEPVYAHRAGDIIKDAGGNNVILTPADIEYQVGFTLIDGRYRLANTTAALTYKAHMADSIANYLRSDILPMAKRLMGRTALFYKPKGALGKSKVRVGAGIDTLMDTRLDWVITFHLSANAYNDPAILKSLTKGAKNVISSIVELTTISVSSVGELLRALLPTQDLLGVDVDHFGESGEYTVITLSDKGASFGVKDDLVVLADGTLDVEPSVNIRFINHQL